MIFALITAWLAYRKASDRQRNYPILWGAAGAVVYIATQLLVTIGIGLIIGFGIELGRWPETLYDDLSLPITAVAILSSIIASWIFLKFVDRDTVPPHSFNEPPPPPPTFGGY